MDLNVLTFNRGGLHGPLLRLWLARSALYHQASPKAQHCLISHKKFHHFVVIMLGCHLR